MRIRVKLFATYREIVGERDLAWTAEDGTTVDAFLRGFLEAYPRLGPHRGSMAVAVNQTIASTDLVLRDGDEIALLPPVSGGAS